ncbi:mitochondrial ribosome and complex I assembly factor AltMIEF1 [Euwallacea similis]|uniref:mitochondrial ribosome and complex I assembly factor AltMIEF1 n=1 Tax=Euwallacea similis TaxID=1736056 RepID=UPI00344D6C4B
MSLPNKREILKLYKNLLRYSEQLQFTDQSYFTRRIKKEFKDNKNITDESDISFKFEKGIILLLRRTVV